MFLFFVTDKDCQLICTTVCKFCASNAQTCDPTTIRDCACQGTTKSKSKKRWNYNFIAVKEKI